MQAKRSNHDHSISVLQALNRDLLGALVFMWAVSVLRVVLGLARHETFGTDGTLALLAVVVVPLLVKNALFASLRDWRGRLGSSQRPNGS